MNSFHLPVLTGPGSQEGEAAEYLPMPHEMATFRMPAISRTDEAEATARAVAVLRELHTAMTGWRFGTGDNPRIQLDAVGAASPGALALINESLGQGEVSALVALPSGAGASSGDPLRSGLTVRTVRIQETAFASIWRVQELAEDGAVTSDALEVGPIPEVIAAGSPVARAPEVIEIGPPPEGYMNSPPILHEVVSASARFRDGQAAHVVNLTLLPVTPEDHVHLETTLGTGNTTILSRGYGNCRIDATAIRNVWWVRYFNSMDTLILDTIEVVGVPQAALAAREDFEDAIERMGQLLAILSEPSA